METVLKAKVVVAGEAEGSAVVSKQPLSLWGGLDPGTGEIIDRRHELSAVNAAGKVLVFPRGKGSSTASAVLVESIRAHVAPAAIINCAVDPIIALGAIVADEMYGRSIPILVVSPEDFELIEDGLHVAVEADGTVTLRPPQ